MGTTQEQKYYHIEKCFVCGREFKSTFGHTYRQFCPECFEKHIQEHDELVKEYAKLKIKIMHETALRKLETCKEGFEFSEYAESIEAIRQMEELSPESFLSAYEILAAIGLYQEDFYFKINHKVGKYKVDFYLPDEKICLEIDSRLHDIGNTRLKDGRRDIDIRNELGKEWETVRISTSQVAKFPSNVGYLAVEIAEKQRELRKKNHGMLPRGYSKSVDEYYKKVFD